MNRISMRVLAGLLAIVACGEPTAPTEVEGTYALIGLNGASLPYDHEGLGCCTYLSGRLDLADGRYVAAITARNRNNGAVFTASEEGSYTQDGGAVTFARESFVIQPLLLSTATVEGSVIRLAFGGEGPGSPDQFHAVFERN